jgi:hypothetical protein
MSLLQNITSQQELPDKNKCEIMNIINYKKIYYVRKTVFDFLSFKYIIT